MGTCVLCSPASTGATDSSGLHATKSETSASVFCKGTQYRNEFIYLLIYLLTRQQHQQ